MESATKTNLRKDFLAKRNALSEDIRMRHSNMIRQRVFQDARWKAAELILCYVSFQSEVETHTLIQEAIRFKKRIAIPIHDPAKKATPISEISRFAELLSSHRGILQVEPQQIRPVDPSNIDLALIPGIAFDRSGSRLGFGGGYFDKLLPHMKKAVRMALAFNAQISDFPLPLETHDVPMDVIVTEKELIELMNR